MLLRVTMMTKIVVNVNRKEFDRLVGMTMNEINRIITYYFE